MQEIQHYDIVVIGSGPAGEKAAMQASKLKKKVALIEKLPRLGGASLHTGTIPSKSLRETVMHLALLRQQTHGIEISFKENLTTQELMYRKEIVIQDQESSLRRNFEKNQIAVIEGTPRFQSATMLEISPADGSEKYEINADFTIIATGSSPRRPKWAPFDNECVFDSDTILDIKHLPKKVTIIGAGVIGCEYASIFSKMGIRVNLIARDRNVLPFIDRQIAENLMYQMRNQRVTLRLGESVEDIEKINSDEVHVKLASKKVLPCSTVLVAAGRFANSGALNLDKVGVELGNNGLIKTNANFQTAQPNIYAVGDVIGFPGLASTSMAQARIAVLDAFDKLESEKMPRDLPLGIWTIPAVSMVGKTEEELTDDCIPYEIGIAHFKEISRAHIMGEEDGILKLLFDPETLKILGVHIIGPHASELIHLGHSVMFFEGTIKYFMNTVFNSPTLDEAYRVAAFNGINRLDHESL
ncbi:MAG: Si-specific NAD(P)(+) transhydrogenase [SAR324 cluster bacterium]|nr:Si-specific NAD(P)(+) transhydrogenase [SAR324 cluster bacterium]MBL7034719.1 Si-specific NAD(P)(+) transhydrogenase [SAR324 cluster bacterium]